MWAGAEPWLLRVLASLVPKRLGFLWRQDIGLAPAQDGKMEWGYCPLGLLEGLWIMEEKFTCCQKEMASTPSRQKKVAKRIPDNNLSAPKFSVQISITLVVQVRKECKAVSGRCCPILVPQVWLTGTLETFSSQRLVFYLGKVCASRNLNLYAVGQNCFSCTSSPPAARRLTGWVFLAGRSAEGVILDSANKKEVGMDTG